MTKPSVIEDFHNANVLCAQYELLTELMLDLKRRYTELNERITKASAIMCVIKGVPLDSLPKDIGADGQTTRTLFHLLEDNTKNERSTHVYETVSRTGWCVRINDYDAQYREKWNGGYLLGLGKGWTQTEADTVARAWLIYGEIKQNGIYAEQ